MRELALLAALLASPAAAQIKNPDTFVYALSGEIETLDPHWIYDAVSSEVLNRHVYETLIGFAGDSAESFEPLLAERVPDTQNGLLSRDGRRWAFRVRGGAKFHDGAPVTAEDVRYSLLRYMLMDRANGPSYLLLEPVTGLSSTRGADGKPLEDAFTLASKRVRIEGGAVVLELDKPYPPLLSVLAGVPIVSRLWAAAQGAWDGAPETWARYNDPLKPQLHERANGTGPFRLERWDRQTRQVFLTRFDGYWRAPAKLKRAVFRTVPDATTRRLLLLAGDVDAVMADRTIQSQLEGLDGAAVIDNLPMLAVHYFGMTFDVDVKGNPFVGTGSFGDGIPADFFSDLDVRKGFAYAFDYDAYARDGFRGRAERARGPIPRGVFGYNARQPLHERDPNRAAEHLRKAHGGRAWKEGFRFTLAYSEGQLDRQLACQIMKKEVEALNPKFHVDVIGLQNSTFLSASRARKLPMMNGRWNLDYADPINAVEPFLHSKGHYAAVLGYANPRADRFLEQAKRETDRDQRRRLFFELQQLAFADAPQIFTVDAYRFQALRTWVKGWSFNPIFPYGYLYPVSKEL